MPAACCFALALLSTIGAYLLAAHRVLSREDLHPLPQITRQKEDAGDGHTAVIYFTHGEPETYDPIGWINQFREFDEQEIPFVPLAARPYFLHALRKKYLLVGRSEHRSIHQRMIHLLEGEYRKTGDHSSRFYLSFLDDNPRPNAAVIQALNEGASRIVVAEVFLTISNHTAEGKDQIQSILEQLPNIPVSGIPGSPTAAVLLGGLLIWALQPGPLLFVEKKEFVWGLIASMYLGNIVGLIIVLTTVPWWAAILRIPFSIIAPVIVVICAIGAYTGQNSFFDVAMMLVFGVVGYVFKKLKYPLGPLVLALVLGDMAETAFRQSMLLSRGSIEIFWANGLVGTIMTLAVVLLYWPLMSRVVEGWRGGMQPFRRGIRRAIVDAPPMTIRDRNILRCGFNAELDELVTASTGGKEWIAKLQQDEIERTGIASLKVRYNDVFGYYIEVTKANLAKVPADYIRKQTVVNGERFYTPALKEKEDKIRGADDKADALAYNLFHEVRATVLAQSAAIQQTASALAALDVLAGLAELARHQNYARPEINEGNRIEIVDGRHPVLEQTLVEDRFVPNDVTLDDRENLVLVNIWTFQNETRHNTSNYKRQDIGEEHRGIL